MAHVFRSIFAFIARFWPSMVVLCVILYATLTSDPLGDEELPLIPNIDKVIHFLMMGGLASAVLFDIRRHRMPGEGRRQLSLHIIIYVALGVALFSVFDEWLQGQLSIGRPSDPVDAVANLLGILAASLLAPPVLRRMFP